jgi:hypothetical protein
VDPAILIRDAAAAAILVIVELGRQDYRVGWWRGFGASHPPSVAGASSVSPCVADRPPHEQPPGDVNERQAACRGGLPKPSNWYFNVFLCPVRPSGVEQSRSLYAQTASVVADADNAKQLF